MKLTDLKVRNLKPEDKQYKVFDGKGLFLLVHTNGSKYWRINYRIGNKFHTVAVGVYPDVSIAEAREKLDEIRNLLKQGIDPRQEKIDKEMEKQLEKEAYFSSVARMWWESQKVRWKENHAQRIIHSLELDVFPLIGDADVRKLRTPELKKIIDKVQSRGVNNTALKILQRMKSVFNYAIQIGLIDHNPALPLTGIIIRRKEQHQPALAQDMLPEFFQKLAVEPMKEITRIAFKLQIIWFVRPGELRQAKWTEFDFEKREWHIPAAKMKMKRAHIVPLSDWALQLLEELKALSGYSEFLFPNPRDANKPMSENALSYAMARMGYKGIAVPHGFRSLATDVLNENNFKPDVIERQLAHIESNRVRAAYHRTEYFNDRHEMMEWYSRWVYQRFLQAGNRNLAVAA